MLKKIKLKLTKYNKITELLGWYGAIAAITAFALLNLDVFTSDSLTYQVLNITAAIGIIIDAFEDGNTQPVVLNIIWGIIAGIGILNIIL